MFYQVVEKVFFVRLLKNAQMQVEHCEIPVTGAPQIPRPTKYQSKRTWQMHAATSLPPD
jgi:hypothetical protein